MDSILLHETAPASRRRLRLLVQDLSEHDIAKLAAFLRVGADRLACEWKMVFVGDSHALLHGGDEPSTVQGLLDDPLEIRRVFDASGRDTVDSAALARPLQYDAVMEMLLQAERKSGAGVEPAASARPAAPALPTAPARPVSLELLAGARYRLRRWPNAALVQSSRDHLRVASFLSTRHVDIAELARLANLKPARCEEIVAALTAEGYLDVKPAAPPAEAVAAAGRTEPAAARPGAADVGLFARIRRKFGLGGHTA